MRLPRDRKEPRHAAGSASTAALSAPASCSWRPPLPSVGGSDPGGMGPTARWILERPVSSVGPASLPAGRPPQIQEDESMYPTAWPFRRSHLCPFPHLFCARQLCQQRGLGGIPKCPGSLASELEVLPALPTHTHFPIRPPVLRTTRMP